MAAARQRRGELGDDREAYKPEASAGRVFLEALRAQPALDWTFLSPSAEFNPGVRTGSFRLGTDQLHSRRRFTVGY